MLCLRSCCFLVHMWCVFRCWCATGRWQEGVWWWVWRRRLQLLFLPRNVLSGISVHHDDSDTLVQVSHVKDISLYWILIPMMYCFSTTHTTGLQVIAFVFLFEYVLNFSGFKSDGSSTLYWLLCMVLLIGTYFHGNHYIVCVERGIYLSLLAHWLCSINNIC